MLVIKTRALSKCILYPALLWHTNPRCRLSAMLKMTLKTICHLHLLTMQFKTRFIWILSQTCRPRLFKTIPYTCQIDKPTNHPKECLHYTPFKHCLARVQVLEVQELQKHRCPPYLPYVMLDGQIMWLKRKQHQSVCGSQSSILNKCSIQQRYIMG